MLVTFRPWFMHECNQNIDAVWAIKTDENGTIF